MIREVWFDAGGTLYRETPAYKAAHETYLLGVMASVTGESDLAKVRASYKRLYQQQGSNSSVFQALGMSPDYWQQQFEKFDADSLLQTDPVIVETLKTLSEHMPISVFTNIRAEKLRAMLTHLNIPADFFTHVLSAVDVGVPKPALPGFRKMVELTRANPRDTLYVGDEVTKDIRPAKEVGMQTCLVWSQSPEADFSIINFRDLLQIVGLGATGQV